MRTFTIILISSLLLLGCTSTEGNVNYGLNHYDMGLFNHAIPSLLSSTPELEKQTPSDPRVTRAYLALGIMAKADKMYNKAEEFMLKALSTAELVVENKNTHIRNAHNTIGNFYISQKKYKSALPHLEKALVISERENKDPVLTAIDIDNIALVYSELGEHSKSLELSNKALALNDKASNHKHYLRTKGVILFNQGKTYERLNQFDSAVKNYDASIKVLSELVNTKPHESWRIDVVKKAKKSIHGENEI